MFSSILNDIDLLNLLSVNFTSIGVGDCDGDTTAAVFDDIICVGVDVDVGMLVIESVSVVESFGDWLFSWLVSLF